MRPGSRAVPLLAAAILVTAGCAGRPAGTPPAATGPPQATETPSPGQLRLWIAVFETAENPNDLEDSASELMDRAGTAVVVAPEGCYGGLRGRAEVPPGHYVLAVVATSRHGLDSAVDRARRDPVLTARVRDRCPL